VNDSLIKKLLGTLSTAQGMLSEFSLLKIYYVLKIHHAESYKLFPKGEFLKDTTDFDKSRSVRCV